MEKYLQCLIVYLEKLHVLPILNWTWDTLNSNFSTALFGAFAGAYGAQLIATRTERQRRLLDEIRSTNAAIMVAYGIFNNFVQQKKQHVKSLKDTYSQQREAFKIFKQLKETPQQPFIFQADFRILQHINAPTQTLQNLLFEKLSTVGRPLIVVSVLSQCMDGLKICIDRRNELIEWSRNQPPQSQTVLLMYFGEPTQNGKQDTSYPDCINGISDQVDDCIFFSKLIAEDLNKHGEALAKSFGKKSPKIQKPDFSQVESELLPKDENYLDWLDMTKPSKN